MAEPVRVLHVITGMGSGGAESFLMNMCQHIDSEKVKFDFLLRSEENIYRETLNSMGSQVYYTASFPRHWIKNWKQTEAIIMQGHYDVVHVHANALLYPTPLILAKRYSVPCRIMHSHNTSMMNMHYLPIHLFFKKHINMLATQCFACSDSAGKWMFGNSCPFTVIQNAVDVKKFSFDQTSRIEIRKEFGIPDDAFVVGHVGRFWEQKNHAFLLNAFAGVLEQKNNSYLILLGEGKLERMIEAKAREMGLGKHVIFAGVRKDVSRVLSAFDVFAFPSLYEGLSVVAIEAQANGLPIICSEATPSSVLFSAYSKQLPLSAGSAAWSAELLAAEGHRCNVSAELRQAGYDIHEEARKLQEFYCSQVC